MNYFLTSSVVFFILLIYSEAQNEKPIPLGCYKDYPARKLKGISYEDKAITLNSCFKKCLSLGYPYTALSRDECHCTRHPELLQSKVADCECNTGCSGDIRIKCGGTWRLSVYYFLPECHEVSTLRYLDTVYLGCYSDTYDRKLQGHNFTDKALTPDICKTKCMGKGFLFAGLQEGIYCYCGNQQPLQEDKVSEHECNYSCKGHHCKQTKCGGNLKNAIYAVGECITISEEYREGRYLGCFKDSSQKDLYMFNISSSKLQVNSCLKECKKRGYMYAALHAGEDCLCGNKHAAFADKQVETKCNILCQRDTSRCGGEGMSNVYALEQICLAVAPVYMKPNYLGCFLDTPARKLNGHYYACFMMTPSKCIETCQLKNFIYAGVQNGDQCFCGNEELYAQERKPESECSTKCKSDNTQNCGGFYRNGIYEAGMCVQVKEPYYTREEQFLGCYKDPGEGLVGHSYTGTQLTLNHCFSECKGRGFVYAGVHAAKTCYCGNNHIPLSKKTSEYDCDMFCEGGELRCGGENHFNLFNLQQLCEKVEPLNTMRYLGCYQDEGKRKLNKEELVVSVTPERCIQRCLVLGYIYAGLQNGVQCFCGNREPLLEDRRSELDCNTKCQANVSEICGGYWKNSVYEAGKCEQVRFSHNQALQLGCYKMLNESEGGFRTLLQPAPSSLKCIRICQNRGYKYAAMEGGMFCLCKNQDIILEGKVSDSECDKNCAGDTWKCGGDKRVNLFNVLNCNKVIPDEYHAMYYGCFIDTNNPRTFRGDRLDSNMTPEKCIKHCQHRGFYYASLRNGNECYCSGHDIVLPARSPDVYCNLKCTGNSYKTCGGYNNNAVYILRSCLHVTQQKRPAQYLGCFKDDENQNIGHQFTYPYLTPHSCIRECKKRKFLYAGMQSGDNCKCWIDQSVLLYPANEEECNINCPGRETTHRKCETELVTTRCGGDNRIDLYTLLDCEKVEPIDGTIKSLGCMVDDLDRRLKGHYFIDEKLTPRKCIDECQRQGFLFAGLQEGIYCFCGSEQEALKERADQIKCNTSCAGNINRKCGGHLVQNLYLVGMCTEASTFQDFLPNNR